MRYRETLFADEGLTENSNFHKLYINKICNSPGVTTISPAPSFFRCPFLVLYLTLYKFNTKSKISFLGKRKLFNA